MILIRRFDIQMPRQGPAIRSALHAIVAERLHSAENTIGDLRTFLEYEATTIWDSYWTN